MRTYMDQLEMELTLVGATTKVIAGGDIKAIDLHLTNWGWSGTLEFDIYDTKDEPDTFRPSYFGSKLIQITLKVRGYLSDQKETRDPPLVLKGLVSQRALRDLPTRNLPISKQVLTRRYRIEAADAAQVLWRQHHPCQLYADKTMQQIIEQQKGGLIKFEGDWSWVSREPYKTPMVLLALDPTIGKASFYDWIMWYVDRFRLIWTYNCRTDTYSIVETKSDQGTAIAIDWRDFRAPMVQPPPFSSAETLPPYSLKEPPPPYSPKELPPPYSPAAMDSPVRARNSLAPRQARYEDDFYELYQRGYTVDAPPVPRYRGEVLDSFTAATTPRTPIANAAAAETGMMRQTLLRTALDNEVSQRVALESARLVPEPLPELSLYFSRIPVKPVFPGDVAQFTASETGWSQDAWPVEQKSFRVYDVLLQAQITNPGEGSWHKQTHAEYELGYAARLELQRDVTTPRLPAFVEPTYPVYVEAKILSGIESTDIDSLTYDHRKPIGPYVYRVEVPLWKDPDYKETPDNRTAGGTVVTAPFNPGGLPGQLFFPAYKNERVVLAMTWRKARIDTFVEWRDYARVPPDLQGNHLMLGKKRLSRTSLVNYYENEGSLLPIFKLARINDVDRQKVVITEGNLLIEVNEESTEIFEAEHARENEQD